MAYIYEKELIERFLSYVKINTRSDGDSNTSPSTKNQFELARLIKEELENLKLQNINLSDRCYLTACIPANTATNTPVIGLIAHLDTSADMNGENVKPLITTNYNGDKIVLNKEKNINLDPAEFPELKNYLHQDIITTSGDTLLGADNKAGLAEIVTAASYLVKNPEIKHGEIRICFTPDEEIGRGADFFDVEKFGAVYAYTIDGGEIGSLEYETFNAANAVITIKGKNVHPGAAKDIMINSQLLAMEFNAMLPVNERPEHTSGYEGFYHLIKMEGHVEESILHYLIRDHDKLKFLGKKREIQRIADYLNTKYKRQLVTADINDSYYNMKQIIEKDMKVMQIAMNAFRVAGIEPRIEPIRGGTDGARLSYMGLPTPNVFTGGHNFHSRYEFIPVQSMLKAVEVIINICSTLP